MSVYVKSFIDLTYDKIVGVAGNKLGGKKEEGEIQR